MAGTRSSVLILASLLLLGNVGFISGRYSEVNLAVPCSNPWVGMHSSSNYTSPAYEGAIIRYTCLDGYQLIGSPTRRCLKNGSWEPDMPTCEPKNLSCGFPGHAAHTNVRPNKENYRPGDSVEYTCDIGYVLVGRTTRHCLESGKWTYPVPYCAAKLSSYRRIMAVSQNVDANEKKSTQGFAIVDNQNHVCSFADKTNTQTTFWKVDLFESNTVDIIVLMFAGKTDAAIKLSVGYHPSSLMTQLNDRADYSLSNWTDSLFVGREYTFYEYKLRQPMDFQYLSIEIPPTKSTQIGFCELLVLSNTAYSSGLCFADAVGQTNPAKVASTFMYNSCYTYLHEQDESWSSANINCKNYFNGSLPVDVDLNVQNMMKVYLQHNIPDYNNDRNYWIGTNAVDGEKSRNTWYWLNGQQVNQFFWGRGQPNMPSNEKACMSLGGQLEWQWEDRPCVNRLHYICQHSVLRCGTPEIPENAFIENSLRQTNVGTKIRYSCRQGFVLEGRRERECLPTGRWSDITPFCQLGSYAQSQTASLTIGVIIAIVCGIIFAVLLIVAVIVFIMYGRKKSGAKIMKFSKQTESAETLDVDDKKSKNYSSTDETK